MRRRTDSLLRARFMRAPLVVSAVLVALTVAVVPIVKLAVGPTVSFLPSVLTAVTCFDVISLYFLAGEFRDTGDRRILVTGWAYLYSLIVMVGYAMAFPGVFSSDPPLASAPSVAPYLYISWHAGFPILLGLAWGWWPARIGEQSRQESRQRHLLVTSGLVALLSIGIVAATVRYVGSWPTLIVGNDFSGMVRATAPVALPLVFISLLLIWSGVRLRTGPERWAAVAVVVCFCDLVLTYLAQFRYSLGWYAGRSLTMVAAGVLLIAMLGSLRRMKSSAEHRSAYDGLTGLPNRQSAYDAATRMFARAQRAVTPLSVIAIDLDHFKQINDRHGPPAGDQVLAAVGIALPAAVRNGDLPARVGGEEFLVLLPDTGQTQAALVAERIRAAIEALHVPDVGPLSASLGVASLTLADTNPNSLLLRADQALYAAKQYGRNQVQAHQQRTQETLSAAV